MRKAGFRGPGRAILTLAASAVAVASGAAALAAELSSENVRETSVSEGTPIFGLRPTGVGLPEVGAVGTVGAGDYPEALREYHDSGQYARDLEAVGMRAERYVVRRSRRLRARARDACRAATERGVPAVKRRSACEKPRHAIVLDIDETALSHYDELAASNFSETTAALALAVAQASSPAIEPVRRVYRVALEKRLSVFFITGRPGNVPGVRDATARNLAAAGYDRYERLVLNDTGKPTIPYKSGHRAAIEEEGFDVVANLGDQESDLAGGHADRAFKLPNPFYFIG